MKARRRGFGVFGVIFFALVSAQAFAEDGAWNQANNPANWSTQYNYQFDLLPLKGQVEGHQPWSDTYWPSNQGGIAARWMWPGQPPFKYKPLWEWQVRGLRLDQLAKLSPAEKYDIFMGRFDYPTVKAVRDTTSKNKEYWRGICDGWSQAALFYAEPAPVRVTGPSGIEVPFGSDDVKALLDEYYADHGGREVAIGERCQAGEGGSIFQRIGSAFLKGSSACEDVNAGAMHVIFANELGIRHQGFIADVDRWREVWNQPIYRFESTVIGEQRPSPDAARGTVIEKIIHTDMYYADELEEPSWEPIVGTSKFKEGVEHYDYTVELNAYGSIIGGKWISENRPDVLWNAPRVEFEGYMSGLNQIYRPGNHAFTAE